MLGVGALGLVVAFGLAQLIPYRVSNPPLRQEPTWTSARGRALVAASCFDCHSNQTRTFWYSRIAPISWWTTNHVKDGRNALNFSDWANHPGEGDIAETVVNGSMPPSYYTWFGLHSDAKLSAADKATLIAELRSIGGRVPAGTTPAGG